MKTIQIACVPTSWDDSTITAVGTTRNGRAALPKSTVARDLPAQWLEVWHGLVEAMRQLDPGGWAACYVTARKVWLATDDADAGEVAAVQMVVHRRWDDATTADPVGLDIKDENAVALFDWLTRDEQPAIAE